MTTIAYRDGILATDSLLTGNDVRRGTGRKIMKLRDGTLVAMCGSPGVEDDIGDYLENWFAGKRRWADRPQLPDKAAWAVIVRPDLSLFLLSSDLLVAHYHAPYMTQGSGNEIALGALGYGASAIDAVKVACDLDTGSGLPVQYGDARTGELFTWTPGQPAAPLPTLHPFDEQGRIVTMRGDASASPLTRTE